MEKLEVNGQKITKIHDKILVFHDTLTDPKGLIKYYTEDRADEWIPWYTFGDMMVNSGPGDTWDEFPSEEEWRARISNELESGGFIKEGDIYTVEVGEAWHRCSKLYVELTGTKLSSYTSTRWSLARYFPGAEPLGNRTMNYHTDYQQDSIDTPQEQAMITGVSYPNDDYEGGEIGFRKFPDDKPWDEAFEEAEFEYIYKPKAGDLIIFPSDHPFYHGVYNVYEKPKYIFRHYWNVKSEGSALWHELKAKYGDEFEEMEKVRKKRSDIMYRDAWSMSIRIPFEEYYRRLEDGTLPEPDPWEPRPSDYLRPKQEDQGYGHD